MFIFFVFLFLFVMMSCFLVGLLFGEGACDELLYLFLFFFHFGCSLYQQSLSIISTWVNRVNIYLVYIITYEGQTGGNDSIFRRKSVENKRRGREERSNVVGRGFIGFGGVYLIV